MSFVSYYTIATTCSTVATDLGLIRNSCSVLCVVCVWWCHSILMACRKISTQLTYNLQMKWKFTEMANICTLSHNSFANFVFHEGILKLQMFFSIHSQAQNMKSWILTSTETKRISFSKYSALTLCNPTVIHRPTRSWTTLKYLSTKNAMQHTECINYEDCN